MRIFSRFLLVFLMTSYFVFAQGQQAPQTPTQQLPNIPLVTKFNVGDVIFVYNVLNSIEISATEVEAFLQCKEFLGEEIQKIQSESMKITDDITINYPLPIAQNTINFINRGTFSGAQAERYKRFVDALKMAAEKVKQEQQGK